MEQKKEESNRTTSQSDWAGATMLTIQMYYTPILVSLGTFGNCLSVYVFFRTKMRRASSSWYLSALAISDSGFLVSLFVAWLEMVDVGIFSLPGYCQFFLYLSSFCSFLSVWFVVSFTVERFIAVQYPLRRQSMCTVARAKMILISLSVLGLILCSPVLWFSSPGVDKKTNTTGCRLIEEFQLLASAFNAADTILTFVLPFTVILILNGLITINVWRLARVRRTLTSNSRNRRDQRCNTGASQTKVTKMLLIISSVFLCFNLPAYVMRVHAFLEVHQDNPPRSTLIAQHISNLLFDTNFGINFVLYCASGQNFRKAVLRMILRKPRRWYSGTPISNHVSDFRRSSSMGRQRTILYEVPWTEGCELRQLSGSRGNKSLSRKSTHGKP